MGLAVGSATGDQHSRAALNSRLCSSRMRSCVYERISAMLSATRLRCVVAVGLLALGVAGCSANLTRLEDHSFQESAQKGPEARRSRTLAVAASDSGTIGIPRPKADLTNSRRSADVAT